MAKLNETQTRAMKLMLCNRFKCEALEDTDQYTHRFQIKSTSSARMYVVAMKRWDDYWCCGCTGWTTHRKCKHLTKMQSALITAFGGRPFGQGLITG